MMKSVVWENSVVNWAAWAMVCHSENVLPMGSAVGLDVMARFVKGLSSGSRLYTLYFT